MKGFIAVLIVVVLGIGFWGYQQSQSKTIAFTELAKAKTENQKLNEDIKTLKDESEYREKQISSLKTEKTTAQKAATNSAAEIEKLNHQITQLQKEIKSLQEKVSAKQSPPVKPEVKTETKKASANTVTQQYSAAALRQQKALEYKIKCLEQSNKRLAGQVRNIEHAIVSLNKKTDAKGWYYRSGSSRHLKSMATLPKHWNRKEIRIVYISKEEKKEKMKQGYLQEIAANEEKISQFKNELASLK